MKIGTRTRYGLRTLLEIADNESSGGIFQKEIALNQELSIKYLDHIIHALKTSNLICNVKGKKSGYMLTRSPDQISIFDIYNAFEPGICLVECLSDNFICDRNTQCVAKGLWGDLNILIINYLKSVTLSDLLKKRIELPDFITQPVKKKRTRTILQ